jgi:hypothetical protein
MFFNVAEGAQFRPTVIMFPLVLLVLKSGDGDVRVPRLFTGAQFW